MRLMLKVLGVSVLMASALHGGAFSQTKSPTPAASALPSPDPITLDVAGVRLGMSVEEATNALKQFDSNFVIVKNYLTEPNYEHLGWPKETNNNFLDYVTATKTVVASNSSYKAYKSGGASGPVTTNPEQITVYFSPVPAQERVIAVQRELRYDVNPQPFDTVQSGMLNKYPNEISVKATSYGDFKAGWIFDVKNRLVSSKTAASRHRGTGEGRLPGNITSIGGIVLTVDLISGRPNTSIASVLNICIFNEGALYKSIEQASSTIAKAHKEFNDAELEKLKKQNTQTKF